jgi:chemotaxis protein CheD
MLAAETAKPVKVMMAGIGYGGTGERLETLVGSCVGVVLWDRQRKCAGLAHVVLPESCGREGPPGKFADTAIAALKAGLASRGSLRLVAKIAGGATMFGERSDRDVGEKNYQAVRQYLQRHNIPLVAEHIGGNQGRMLYFSPDDGTLAVHVARQLVATI